jgi:hypothetical protein
MSLRRVTTLALAATLAVFPATANAQHCWPAQLALLVRGSAGAIVSPENLDRLDFAPEPSRGADFAVRKTDIDLRNSDAVRGHLPAMVWSGRGDCRIELREVVLRQGETEMRLWLDVIIDTQRRPGPSAFSLETPPMATGTWRLAGCTLPAGKTGVYVAIPPRWERLSGGAHPRPAGSVCAPTAPGR